jgi:hypothetical protein
LRKEDRNGEDICALDCACVSGDAGATVDGLSGGDVGSETSCIGWAVGVVEDAAGCVGGVIDDVLGLSAGLEACLVGVGNVVGDADFSEDDFTVAREAAAALVVLLVVALAAGFDAAVVVVDFDSTCVGGSITESWFGMDFLARFVVVVVVSAFVVTFLPASLTSSTAFFVDDVALGFFAGSGGISSTMLGLGRAAVVALRTPDVFCTDMVASVGWLTNTTPSSTTVFFGRPGRFFCTVSAIVLETW